MPSFEEIQLDYIARKQAAARQTEQVLRPEVGIDFSIFAARLTDVDAMLRQWPAPGRKYPWDWEAILLEHRGPRDWCMAIYDHPAH